MVRPTFRHSKLTPGWFVNFSKYSERPKSEQVWYLAVLLYLNKGDVIPSFSAAETILPDDVIEEIHHHVAGQDGQHHVSHRFATVAPPMKKFDLEIFFFQIQWNAEI